MQTAASISFGEEEDVIIWQYNLCDKYSVQSVYVVINNRSVRQVFFVENCGPSKGFIFFFGCWSIIKL
jgi:hypothetical protein